MKKKRGGKKTMGEFTEVKRLSNTIGNFINSKFSKQIEEIKSKASHTELSNKYKKAFFE